MKHSSWTRLILRAEAVWQFPATTGAAVSSLVEAVGQGA